MVVLFSIRNNNDENWIVDRPRKITAASSCGDRRGCRGDRMKMRAAGVVGGIDVLWMSLKMVRRTTLRARPINP